MPLPASMAGQRLAAWLKAFNTGQYETVYDFIAANFAPVALEEHSATARASRQTHMLFYETRGLVPARIEEPSEHAITMLARSRLAGDWVGVTVAVEAEPPHRICRFGMGFHERLAAVRSAGPQPHPLDRNPRPARPRGPTHRGRTLRVRLITVPGRLVNRAGTPTLRGPSGWPWAAWFTGRLQRLRALRPVPG